MRPRAAIVPIRRLFTMIEALLFDLGNVLLNINFNRAFEVWGAHAGVPPAALAQRFRQTEAYERHERGEIDAAEYFESLRGDLQVSLNDRQFTEGWNAILLDEKRAITRLVASLPAGMPRYVFSNSNETHKQHWLAYHGHMPELFDRVFISSDIGLRKPEAAAFDFISTSIEVDPPDILFFDDLLSNVEGARRAGLQALQVTSEDVVINALQPFLAAAQGIIARP
jgi:putative hydrolase of the HAD superfamily